MLTKEALFLDSREDEVGTNWKFLVDSLAETYHFMFAHKKYLSNFKNSMKTQIHFSDNDFRISIPMDDFNVFADDKSFQGINLMYYIFPRTFILFLSDSFVCFEIHPITVSKSKLISSVYIHEDGIREKAEKSFEFLELILKEDFEILESQQKNLSSVSLKDKKKFLLTPYEGGIKHFHDKLSELVKSST